MSRAPDEQRHPADRQQNLEDSENLPEPDVLAQEITDDLQTALEQFSAVAAELKSKET